MKKAALFIFLVFTWISANAQMPPSVQWQRSLGGINIESANAIERTADGGYIVACVSASADGDVTKNQGGFDCWLVKLTSWGNIVWQKSYGGSASDVPASVKQTTDGGYILASKTRSVDGDVTGNHGGYDYWIVKTDDTGSIQWKKCFGGTNNDAPMSVIQTTDGGYIVTGFSESVDGDVTINHGNEDIWVVKLSVSGSIEWQKSYGGSAEDDGGVIIQTTDGGYIVAANTFSTNGDVTGNHGAQDFWIIKLSAAGAIEWQRCYGGSGTELDGDHAYTGTIEQTTDGGYIVAGLTNSSDGDVTGYHGGAFYDYWVVKLSPTGSITWQKSLGGTNDDDGYSARQTADGGYIVSGTSNSADGDISSGHGVFDYWIVKLSSAGGLVWEKSYGGSLDEYAYVIRPTSDSEYIVCGYSKSNDIDVSGNHGDYDGWVVKLAYCSLPVVNSITGLSSVCAGSAIQLSNNTTGGTWSTSNSNAAVSGGLVTGAYAGNVAIFYSKMNSCGTGGATHIVNVKPKPAPVIVETGTTLSTTTAFSTYQWIKNDTVIAGATNATYTVTANGIYSVTVTNSFGCSSTSVADTVSGVDVSAINNNPDWSVIPNPTKGIIYINGSRNVHIKVYNIMGQLVKETDHADHISIAEFPNGMYFIRLFDERGIYMRQEKVMKN